MKYSPKQSFLCKGQDNTLAAELNTLTKKREGTESIISI